MRAELEFIEEQADGLGEFIDDIQEGEAESVTIKPVKKD